MPMTVTASDESSSQVIVRGVMIGTTTTTNTTPTTIITMPTSTNDHYKLWIHVKGVRTDVIGNMWLRTLAAAFKNVGGVVTQPTSTSTIVTDNDGGTGSATGFVISGTNILFQVTGRVSETWAWTAHLSYF